MKVGDVAMLDALSVRPNGSVMQAIAFISTQLEDMPVPTEAALKRLFDLTPAEIRLAKGLAGGDRLDKVAGGLGIRITTARTQLASIFSKTDTRQHAKLVAVLSRLAHLGY